MSHGTGFHYSNPTPTSGSRGPGDYLSNTGRLHEDPLALHQALGQAVDEAHQGMDDNQGFISDLPLLKMKGGGKDHGITGKLKKQPCSFNPTLK